MIKLKTVVQQLTPEDYQTIEEQFQKNRADKFRALLSHLRQPELSEKEIYSKLTLNKAAYYTLKSRLYEKIQEYLFVNVKDPRIELIRNVSNIPNLLFNTPKDTAIALLKKLEKKLIEYDMPNELTQVYSALKKLHLSSPKYFEYAQLYNKHVAYTIGLDKAEDLLSRFAKSLGEYKASRNVSETEVLDLMRMEMSNLYQLYESHHLAIYRNIMDISFSIYIPFKRKAGDSLLIEKMLDDCRKIFEENPRDATYKYLTTVVDFLTFEYYHKSGQMKLSTPYFEKVNTDLNIFILADHCCFTANFLTSKLERYALLGIGEELEEEDICLENAIRKEDAPSYLCYGIYKAGTSFYAKKYGDAISSLQAVLNELSFKNMIHAELEAKLFLALNYCLIGRRSESEVVLKNILRKLRERKEDDYKNVTAFVKLLSVKSTSDIASLELQLQKLAERFVQQNDKDPQRMLKFIVLDKAMISLLAKAFKKEKN
jgi:hypothetical protein